MTYDFMKSIVNLTARCARIYKRFERFVVARTGCFCQFFETSVVLRLLTPDTTDLQVNIWIRRKKKKEKRKGRLEGIPWFRPNNYAVV